MSSTCVPLISSSLAGPLGVVHLPRLWLKASLAARGRLAEGYREATGRLDQMVIDGLGLQRETFLAFIRDEHPSYVQLEVWIRRQPSAKLDPASITKLNESILGFRPEDAKRQAILSAVGLPEDDALPRDAVNLNNLDDWAAFHRAELK